MDAATNPPQRFVFLCELDVSMFSDLPSVAVQLDGLLLPPERNDAMISPEKAALVENASKTTKSL